MKKLIVKVQVSIVTSVARLVIMNNLKLQKWIGWLRNNTSVMDNIPKNTTIICALVEGFNFKADKEFWKLKDNKSSVRDVYCFKCKGQVVMSNKAYKDYSANGRSNRVSCIGCMVGEAGNKEFSGSIVKSQSIELEKYES